MKKEYEVNLSTKYQLIQTMKNKQKSSMLVWNILQYVGWYIMFSVIILTILWMMPGLIETISKGYIDEALLSFVVFLPVMGICAIIWLLILFIKTYKEKKYLTPWLSYDHEHLWLHQHSMEWGYVDHFKGKNYWLLQMKYEDIERIEWDEQQHLLKVYGPYSGKKWESIQKKQCLDSFDAKTENEHFIFCEYYENFDQLKKDLEEVTHKTIIMK